MGLMVHLALFPEELMILTVQNVLHNEILGYLMGFGLPDHLNALPEKWIAALTNFETTFSMALFCRIGRTIFGQKKIWHISCQNFQPLCFGCSVHAQRIVLESRQREERVLI